MFQKWLTTRSLCISGIIAALYAALTLLLAPISYGHVQCRVSESLTLLPLLTPQAVPGLFVGCVIANLYTGSALDIVFGSLATLLAGMGTYALRKRRWLAVCCPIVVNAAIVGAVMSIASGLPYWLTAAEVALGETAAVAIGCVLLAALKKAQIDLTRGA